MQNIGIDVGFGFTKAYNGKKSVIFNSIIGDVTDIQFKSPLSSKLLNNNLHVTINGKSYFLGQYAEFQSTILDYTLEQKKLIDDFVKILAIAAAGICFEDNCGPINVVSGLPIIYLKRDQNKFKKTIEGDHEIIFHSDGNKDITKKIQINGIHIIPQPIGSIFNLIFDENGKISNEKLAMQKLGVVDIGFRTTDLSIFDHLQYIERGSSTMDTGIAKCFSVIANKLRQESSINVELYKMFKFVEAGIIKMKGKEYNISNLCKKVYSHASSAIASDLNRLWEKDWDIDSIILSGGGSTGLSEYLCKDIDGNVVPIRKDIDARLNNVLGYYKFAEYKWGSTKPAQKTKTSTTKNNNDKTNVPANDDKKETQNKENTSKTDNDETKDKKRLKKISWLLK